MEYQIQAKVNLGLVGFCKNCFIVPIPSKELQ